MTYKHTERACFTGYIVQAVVNNFVPLLFLTFQKQFGIPLSPGDAAHYAEFPSAAGWWTARPCSSSTGSATGLRALLAHGFAALGLIFLARCCRRSCPALLRAC